MQYQGKQITCCAVLIFMLFALSGCAQVQLVNSDKKAVQNDTFALAKRVDLFWANYIDASGEVREYSATKKELIAIEVDMNSLLLKSEAITKKRDSTAQVEELTVIWRQVSEQIKSQGSISNTEAKTYRLQMADLFKGIVMSNKPKHASTNTTTRVGPETTYAYRNDLFREGSK